MFDVNRLYELMFKDIVTPFNLIENAKLDNYYYVKYYTLKEYFVSEMKCSISENDIRIFYYCFDKDNKLQRIYQKDISGKKTLLFDRKNEISKIKSNISKDKIQELIS